MLHYLELEYPQELFKIVAWGQEEKEVSDKCNVFVVGNLYNYTHI